MPRLEGLTADIEVVGQLSILADDTPIQVEFRGRVVAVVLPDIRTAIRLVMRFSRADRRAWMRSIQASLARAGLELQVWVRRRQVGRLTATSRPGWIALRLGVDPMELRTSTILASLVGKHINPSDDARLVDPVSDKT
jgi:hypothetical protein